MKDPITVNLRSKVNRINDNFRYGLFSQVSNISVVCDIAADLMIRNWEMGESLVQNWE